MRYFKKQHGGTPGELSVTLANGHKVEFQSVDGGRTGYRASTDANLDNAFEQMMRENSGGLTEITADEFVNDFVEPKKKGLVQPLSKRSREELSPSGLIGTLAQAKAGVAVAARLVTTDAQGPVVSAPMAKPTQVVPRIGKRGRA